MYPLTELPAGSTARYKTRHVVEVIFLDQTFIGMGMRVCSDVIGVEGAQRAKITKTEGQRGKKMGR